jgi:hypothetical protein
MEIAGIVADHAYIGSSVSVPISSYEVVRAFSHAEGARKRQISALIVVVPGHLRLRIGTKHHIHGPIVIEV